VSVTDMLSCDGVSPSQYNISYVMDGGLMPLCVSTYRDDILVNPLTPTVAIWVQQL